MALLNQGQVTSEVSKSVCTSVRFSSKLFFAMSFCDTLSTPVTMALKSSLPTGGMMNYIYLFAFFQFNFQY